MPRKRTGNYEITVKRGKWRTVWGSGYTKQKAKAIVREMTSKKWSSRRLKSTKYKFTNPRIRKMKK